MCLLAEASCNNMFWHLLPAFLPEVTKILLFAAQASHQLVPPEVSVPPVMEVKWAAGQHGNVTECVCGGEREGELVRFFGKAYGSCSNFCKFRSIVSLVGAGKMFVLFSVRKFVFRKYL